MQKSTRIKNEQKIEKDEISSNIFHILCIHILIYIIEKYAHISTRKI